MMKTSLECSTEEKNSHSGDVDFTGLQYSNNSHSDAVDFTGMQ